MTVVARQVEHRGHQHRNAVAHHIGATTGLIDRDSRPAIGMHIVIQDISLGRENIGHVGLGFGTGREEAEILLYHRLPLALFGLHRRGGQAIDRRERLHPGAIVSPQMAIGILRQQLLVLSLHHGSVAPLRGGNRRRRHRNGQRTYKTDGKTFQQIMFHRIIIFSVCTKLLFSRFTR